MFPSHLKCRAPLRPRRGAGAPLVTEAPPTAPPGVPRPRPAGGAGARSARPGSESERPGRHRGPQAEAQASPPMRAEVAHWLSFRGPSERWVAGPPRCRRGASLCCALRAEASSLEGTASARRSSGPAALSGGDGASGAWGCRSGPGRRPSPIAPWLPSGAESVMRPVWVVSVRVGDLLTRRSLNKALPPEVAHRHRDQEPLRWRVPSHGPPDSILSPRTGRPTPAPCPRRDPVLPRGPLPEALDAEAGSPLALHHAPSRPFRVPFALWNGRPTFSTRLAGAGRVGHRALVRLDDRPRLRTRKARCGVGWRQPSAPRSVPSEARGPRSAGRTGRAGRGRRGSGYPGTGGSRSRGLLLSKPRHSGPFEVGTALGWCNRPRKNQVKTSAPEPKGMIAHEFIAVSAQDSVKRN